VFGNGSQLKSLLFHLGNTESQQLFKGGQRHNTRSVQCWTTRTLELATKILIVQPRSKLVGCAIVQINQQPDHSVVAGKYVLDKD